MIFSLLSNITSLDYDGVLMISLKVSLEECGMQPLIVLVGISQKKDSHYLVYSISNLGGKYTKKIHISLKKYT